MDTEFKSELRDTVAYLTQTSSDMIDKLDDLKKYFNAFSQKIKEMDSGVFGLYGLIECDKMFSSNLNTLADEIFADNSAKGFWDTKRGAAEAIALMHSELSEALEEIRKNTDPTHVYYRESDSKPEGFLYELADTVIRILDYVGSVRHSTYTPIDFEVMLLKKLEFNRTRPHMHGKTM